MEYFFMWAIGYVFSIGILVALYNGDASDTTKKRSTFLCLCWPIGLPIELAIWSGKYLGGTLDAD